MLTIKFDLKAFDHIEIVPIADCHIGNELTNLAKLKEVIDYVAEEPEDPNMARVCLLNGDLTESVTKNSKGNLFETTMTPSVQVATMIQMLKPLTKITDKYPQGKIISYCAGNHDNGRYNDTGISASESIAVGLDLQERYSVNGCYTFIFLHGYQNINRNNSVVTVYNTHMTGSSNSVGGKASRIAKITQNGVIADIIVGSHVHMPMTFKQDVILPSGSKLIQKTITYIITNAFMRYGDYAQRFSLQPASTDVPRIYIRQNRKMVNKVDRRYTYTEVIL